MASFGPEGHAHALLDSTSVQSASGENNQEENVVRATGVENFYKHMEQSQSKFQRSWYECFEPLPGLVFSGSFALAGAWCFVSGALVPDPASALMASLCMIGGLLTFLLLAVCMWTRRNDTVGLMAHMTSDWEEYDDQLTVGTIIWEKKFRDFDEAVLKRWAKYRIPQSDSCIYRCIQKAWLVIRWFPIFYPIWWYVRIFYFSEVAFNRQVEDESMQFANAAFNLGYPVVVIPIIGALGRPFAVTYMCVDRIRKQIEDDSRSAKPLEERYWYKLRLKVHYFSTVVERLWYMEGAGLPWVLLEFNAAVFCGIGANMILDSADEFAFACILIALGFVSGVGGLYALSTFHGLCMDSAPCADSLYAAAYRFHLGNPETRVVRDSPRDYEGHDYFLRYLLNNPMAIRLGGFVVTRDAVHTLILRGLVGLPTAAFLLKKMRRDVQEELALLRNFSHAEL